MDVKHTNCDFGKSYEFDATHPKKPQYPHFPRSQHASSSSLQIRLVIWMGSS